jgi:hypothetical protein
MHVDRRACTPVDETQTETPAGTIAEDQIGPHADAHHCRSRAAGLAELATQILPSGAIDGLVADQLGIQITWILCRWRRPDLHDMRVIFIGILTG